MQITFDTTNAAEVQQVQAIVNMLTGGATVPASTTAAPDEKPDTSAADKAKADKAKADKAKADKAKADKAKADKAKADAEAAAAAAAEAEKEEAPASEFSRDDVRAKLKEHAALEGKDAAIQILKDHGAASITELAEDKFADVMAACE